MEAQAPSWQAGLLTHNSRHCATAVAGKDKETKEVRKPSGLQSPR